MGMSTHPFRDQQTGERRKTHALVAKDDGFMTPFMRLSRNAILSTVCFRDFTVSSNHLPITSQPGEDSLYRLTSTVAWCTAFTNASGSALDLRIEREVNEAVMEGSFGYPSLQRYNSTLLAKMKRC